MQMQMKDRLPPDGVAVDDHAIASPSDPALLGHLGGSQEQLPH
jgi:hypothetical protein